MRNLFKKIVCVFALVFVLASCSNSKDAVSTDSTSNANVSQKKDELVLGIGSEPDNGWDPIKGSTHYSARVFQSALLKRDVDLNIVEDLAQDYSISDDKLTYTINLRKDVKWSDGEDFKADDVVFTYNLAKKELTPGINLTRFVEAKKIDDYTVELILDNPDISFTSSMCDLAIVPKHAYNDDYYKNPIGTGPFKLVEWKKGQQLIVKPNEYYYGDKVPFKKLTFLFFDDENQALATAKTGKCDIIRIPYTANDIKIDGFHIESLKTVDNRGISMPMMANNGEKTTSDQIAENVPIGNDVTSDIAIRKALNIAMDRQEIIDDVLNGEGTKATSIADGLPWYNEETSDLKDGDIEKANEILDEAGWKMADDGIREKDGLKAHFELLYSYKDREDIALYFKEKAKEIGIDVETIYGDWDMIAPKMYNEAILFGWGGYDPLEMYYSYSSKFKGYDYYNANYYGNDTVDQYFEQGLSSTDVDSLNENFKKAQWDGNTGLSWKGDCPWIWLVNENHLYLVNDNLNIGKQKIEPHGGGWTIMDTVSNWEWK